MAEGSSCVAPSEPCEGRGDKANAWRATTPFAGIKCVPHQEEPYELAERV